MACISQDFGSLAPFCCLPRYIRMSRENMAAVPMARNCMAHTASEGFNRGVGLPGMGSDTSGEEPGEEVAAEDSQASNSDASEQVDSEAS